MKLLKQTSRPKLLLLGRSSAGRQLASQADVAVALVFAMSLSVPLMGSPAGQTAAASEAWFIPFFGIVCKGECGGGFCCTLTPF